MPLYTSNYLRGLSQNKSPNERVQLSAESRAQHSSFDIFLCHSFLDKEEVEGIYIELTRLGFKVYVDWIIDPHLDRDNVTTEAAEHIRKRLRSSKTLLLAISANSSLSKWVPWELGYVDGNTQQCALMPISRDNQTRTSFTRTEYLKLYPYVDKPSALSRFSGKLWTVDNAYSYVEFDNWVRGRKPINETVSFY